MLALIKLNNVPSETDPIQFHQRQFHWRHQHFLMEHLMQQLYRIDLHDHRSIHFPVLQLTGKKLDTKDSSTERARCIF